MCQMMRNINSAEPKKTKQKQTAIRGNGLISKTPSSITCGAGRLVLLKHRRPLNVKNFWTHEGKLGKFLTAYLRIWHNTIVGRRSRDGVNVWFDAKERVCKDRFVISDEG